MSLLSIHNITMAYGGLPVIDGATLHVERGQRVCLLGRNGAGKSTLLKIIGGLTQPDSGMCHWDPGTVTAFVPQEVPAGISEPVEKVIRGGLRSGSTEALAHSQVAKVMSLMSLPEGERFDTLSGGLKRRVLLARALVCEPDVLLLDEPTNHLDIDAIRWLEGYLLRKRITLIFVTHDRALIRKLATRIVEIDRGKLTTWECDYTSFLRRKAADLAAEEKDWDRFDKKLAQEEAWIRTGIKARRTRNEGRVRALKHMRRAYELRRKRQGTVTMTLQEGDRSGRIVAEARAVSFSYDDQPPIVRGLDLAVMRGDKVGIVGRNGSGKTTVLKLLLGDLQPREGNLKLGTRLEPLYFDQLRAEIDENKSVWKNVLLHGDHVTVSGRSRHIVGYLEDFLFTRERIMSPAAQLSGGERNRLLLAKLFTQPSNLLVLDEPTNDLDIETLELLEALLVDFSGTVLLVSHDRDFLDNVVTYTLALPGDGSVVECVGVYDQWLARQRKPKSRQQQQPQSKQHKPRPQAPRKLSYKENRELAQLPDRIETLEREQAEIHEAMGQASFYKGDGDAKRATERLKEIEESLQQAFARWEVLEARSR